MHIGFWAAFFGVLAALVLWRFLPAILNTLFLGGVAAWINRNRIYSHLTKGPMSWVYFILASIVLYQIFGKPKPE